MNPKNNIQCRGLPAELMNELFASLPLGNAFNLLDQMPNGLLARNVQKMINNIKEEMKNNKLNEEDCGPLLQICEGGLFVKHSAPEDGLYSVRAILPILSFILNAINKSIITFYFEVQILNKTDYWDYPIGIGFCDNQYPLEEVALGLQNNSNSIGIGSKIGIRIDGIWTKYEIEGGYFEKKDFVGIGIILKPNGKMECFTTFNGNLIEKRELPPKFTKLQLFPAVTLVNAGNSFHANFGNEKWQFKEFGRVLK